ncbi:DUF1592 domain-containing protein [Lignipirellula cremea]|uniref:Planctomycete cytochrome C n=1 Tax=Lignipirellula cremea TaxID=2528010 RepID=A0A518DM21_9BACT|nr:DUF1592 domain-containing protein [Lignipirellula cremea]QDU92889.1 hypothetical protein Pla8534_06620 [Lignipirellula cremea]
MSLRLRPCCPSKPACIGSAVLVFAALLMAPQFGARAAAAELSPAEVYSQQVKPVLQQHCLKCHGEQKQAADFRLDTLGVDFQAGDAEGWTDVLDRLNLGEMPPPKEKQPSAAQRKLLVDWITGELQQAAAAKRSTGGRVVMRRLTRYEYNNTLRDLLGVDLDYAKDLPPEPPSTEGFLNNGSTLEVSPLQIEYYLAAARRGLSEAIVTGAPPEPIQFRIEKTDTGKIGNGNKGQERADPEYLIGVDPYPRHGAFVLRIKAGAIREEGDPYPRMRVALGFQPGIIHLPRRVVGEVDVTATREEPAVYEFRGRIEDFPQPGPIPFGNAPFQGMVFVIDFFEADGSDAEPFGEQPPKIDLKNVPKPERKKLPSPRLNANYRLAVESAEFQYPADPQWPPASHTRILTPRADDLDDRGYARQVVAAFMERAWRRPVSPEEIEQQLTLFDQVRPRMASFEEALRETLASVLISPNFLYLVEQRTDDDQRELLTDYELASRLSYFLWSTMPDEALLAVAQSGVLHDPAVLEGQVQRMLAAPQANQLAKHFTSQWLNLSALDRVAVNPEFHPEFKDALKPFMQAETQHFFEAVLQQNLSAKNLIDADFAMLNYPLAQHYGVTGPKGLAFEKVALSADDRRGGLLTQGSFLLGGSNGESSHPIKRAVWILDHLLDSPPAPPPPDVPELDPASEDLAGLTLKKQLEIHRKKESCNSCHQGIDPWGIPLESYSAVGLWREDAPDVPVDQASVLPDGSHINGVAELKKYLLQNRREQFARAVVKRLLAYSLGRSLELSDNDAVQQLTTEFLANDMRLQELLVALVQSETFRTR